MTRWSEFELLEEIGRGAFGAVHRSFHPRLQQQVALKLVPVSGHDTRAIDRALAEAQRLASVRHPHVVTVHDARYVDGYVGICMEFVRGQSLDAMIAQRGPCDPDEATAYVRTLAGALSAVHRAEIVHNDVKARNVIRETGGRVVLMDFGAGRKLRDPDASTGLTLVGTPLYMAPELFRLHEATPVSDVYSLGVLWFFLLTGEYPVAGDTLHDLADAHATGRRRFIGDFRDDVPADVVRVVARTLHPDPRTRYQSCGSLLEDLSSRSRTFEPAPLVDGPPLPGPPPSDRPRYDRPLDANGRSLRDRLFLGAGVMVSVVLIVAAIGFLASKAYEVMFGLDRELVSESPLAWLETGARTLPLLLYNALVALIAWSIASLLWRITSRSSLTVETWSQRVSRSLLGVSRRTSLDDAASLATILLIAQSAVLLVAWWSSRDVIDAFTTPIAGGVVQNHLLLSVDHDERWIAFRQAMCFMTLAGGYAWWAVWKLRRAADIGLMRIAAGIALTAVSLALATVPWRIVQDATFETAMFGEDRCFVIAQRGGRLQLHCAGARDPTVIIGAEDRRLLRLGTRANIFSAVASKRPPGGP